MKTRILLTAVTTMMLAVNAAASEDEVTRTGDFSYHTQGIVVTRNYYDNGYEFASRINRFHRTYVSFDFYSPIFTETYWYHYTPYTWGVSIYDDWHYYGSGVSRYSWRSGFGGSYWWGYDPYMDYNPWMGYGWSSWYNPGVGYHVNVYLGRPYYHYPVAWNRWDYHSHRHNYRPVYVINNNNYYYNTENRTVNDRNRYYNPSHPYDENRRVGYTSGSGRTGGSSYSRPDAGTGRTQAVPGSNSGNRPAADNAGSNTTPRNRERDKANNGLHMGQERRNVAVPTGTKPNTPARPNNPNINDRTNPGKENTQAANDNNNNDSNSGYNEGQTGRRTVKTRTVQTDQNSTADNPSGNTTGNQGNGAPVRNMPRTNPRTETATPADNTRTRTEVQPAGNRATTRTTGDTETKPVQGNTVKTPSERRETTMRQGTTSSSSVKKETTVRRSGQSDSGKSDENSGKSESGKRTGTSRNR